MAREWNMNLEGDDGLKEGLQKARTAGYTRLFALAYDRDTPVQWHSRPDEASMMQFLDSREESESIMFNCAIAVAVVNPQDSDETIQSVLAARSRRKDTGPGFFSESF
jgi:hypothetical protein